MQEKKTREFEVSGTYIENGGKKKFSITLSAQNGNNARERIFAELGSRQRIKRRNIFIEQVKEVA